ncbi:MAG: hypothetical protein AC479_00290 [miscellaneous Crenarchaeota group-6 archaeon AD8-1]|nr:MAG: hypothetical protein AC479_00290 [miscellaneous Crenarchaeota group-6 archaeon AD8-1]
MKVKTFIFGFLATNCYVVNSDKDALIIDPGFENDKEFDQIKEYINENSLKINLIINTHGHSDHISGNYVLQKKYNCPIGIHINDLPLLGNLAKDWKILTLNEGDFLNIGNEVLEIIFTPGHTKGGISLVGEKIVFTGDTLFSKGIGRMDFPGGSKEDMQKSLVKLIDLPEDYVVFSGHGASSTIGEEKRSNPFLISLK